jgi:hypothetical protein
MIDLYHKATSQLLGSLTEAELQVLIEGLEEESREDRDYYIDAATIDLLADGRATDHLVQVPIKGGWKSCGFGHRIFTLGHHFSHGFR